jgi:uncharacterized protein YjeT (DUF2065 family)
MSDFLVAIGLICALEGILFASFPMFAKQMAASMLETPESVLRIAGVVSGVIGVALIWSIRG